MGVHGMSCWPASAASAGGPGWPGAALSAQTALTAAFLCYQALYWNLLWRPFPLVERTR